MPAQIGGLNILPKKKWHVRTKENIARVKRDEAKAADAERVILERAALAEQESRTQVLRNKAAEKREETGLALADHDFHSDPQAPSSSSAKPEHVNFFADLEEQQRTFGKNKEHEVEKKKDDEKYERDVGILRYLGDGSKEFTKEVPWYERIPDRKKIGSEAKTPTTLITGLRVPVDCVAAKRMIANAAGVRLNPSKPEPMVIKPPTESVKKSKKHSKNKRKRERTVSLSSSDESPKRRKKHKKSKKSRKPSKSSDSEADSDSEKKKKLELLRRERITRERAEQEKVNSLARKLRGEPETQTAKPTVEQKYNNQFNPEICRTNRAR